MAANAPRTARTLKPDPHTDPDRGPDGSGGLESSGPSAASRRSRQRTGRPPLTDRTALLAAARELGFTGLTVGAVTARVGVKYSTFYRHYPTIGVLSADLADDLLAELDLPDPDTPWQTHLADTVDALLELLSRHPGLGAAVLELPQLPRRLVSAYRAMTDCLLAAGFTPAQTALAAGSVLHAALTPDPWPPPGPSLPAADTAPPGQQPTGRPEQNAGSPEAIDPRVRDATSALLTNPYARVRRTVDQLIRGLEHAPIPDGARPLLEVP